MKTRFKAFFHLLIFILLFSDSSFGQVNERDTFCPNMKATISSFGTFTICNGYNLILYGNHGSGLSYQWFLNGKQIEGATNVVYYASKPGTYTIWITKNGCTNISDPVEVTTGTYPGAQISYSKSLRIAQGDSVELQISGGTSWQWFKNFIAVPGATQKSFFAKDSGYYHAEARNGGCSVASNQIKVSVVARPELINTAFDLDLSHNDTIVFHVSTEGTYQWYKNHESIPGATENELQIYTPGIYSVEVDNGIYKVMSVDMEVISGQVLSIHPSSLSDNIIIKNNPFSGSTQIKFKNGFSPEEISISNIQGEIIFQSSNEITDQFSWGENVQRGMYFLQLKKGHSFEVIRLIKN